MKKWCGIAAAAAVLAVGAGQVAQAADDYKSFGVRVRAIYVKPDESTGGTLSTLNTKVSDDIIPELDLEYFFTKNFSTELIAGVTRNDIKLNNGFAGSTWLLPPTLTLKYHPLAGSTFSPYIGFGLNVVFPFNSKVNGVPNFQIDNSVGWAAQAGTDIKITDNLYFNIDYKYLNVDTEATVGTEKCKLDLNPHLIGIGVGYRF
ncbi:outer membrane protein [Trichlorobacter thiogenes]|uniref:Outer membrane protein n=1 Tax=Trichlorobacter thiogenes TaxID=115783 RepID=A0A1T4NZQ6_9BACT|nr:OmpW family outer membrane protein [Trichlorobacter thiogenes]SJZ84536.1 outer membrane protein [Trichlorobacter thiogenes]